MSSSQNSLQSEPNSDNLPSLERMDEMFRGFMSTQAIYVAAKLEVAEHLKNGAKTCEELAVEMGVNKNALYHLMHLWSYIGIVAVDENNTYHLTSLGSYLQADAPNSMRGTVLSVAETYNAWGNLSYSIQTGKPAFEKTFQMSVYEYFAQNAEANAHFNQWMIETVRTEIMPMLTLHDFSNVKTVVDVGGNIGMLSSMILKQYPHLQAILFDQAHVVSGAKQILESAEVATRCQIIVGNFFDSVPSGGDRYLLSRILSNWDDAKALSILKNCRAAMNPDAKLLIIDNMVPSKEKSISFSRNSLYLLITFGQIPRTRDEYYDLLFKAGFQSPKLIETENFFPMIEAVVT